MWLALGFGLGLRQSPCRQLSPCLDSSPGDGCSWTSPRPRGKGQLVEAANGQVLTWPFLSAVWKVAAVLGGGGIWVGLPFPRLPCWGWAMVQETIWTGQRAALSSSTHPLSAAQICPCSGKPCCGLQHFVPVYRSAISLLDRARCHSQVLRRRGHRPPRPGLCLMGMYYRFPGNSLQGEVDFFQTRCIG